MINAVNYENKMLLSVLKLNPLWVSAIVESESFDDIKDLLDNTLEVRYTDSQLEFLREYFIKKTHILN